MTANVPAPQQFQTFKAEFTAAKPTIVAALPKHVKPEKFEAVVFGAVLANPDLLTVDRRSLFKACRDAAEVGLSVNPALGEADILKQYDKRAGGFIARFSPRYGGLMKLARQSGQMRTIYAHTVREDDTFEFELGLNKTLRHVPGNGSGALKGVYCVWVYADGSKDFEYMTRAQVEAIKARSSAKTKEGQVVGPWVTDEEEMWRKTVVRRASKYWPRSPEIERLASAGIMSELDDAEVPEADTGAGFDGAVDVTDWHEEPAAPPAQAGAAQVADLEAKLATPAAQPAAPVAPHPASAPAAPKAAKPRVLAVPQKDGAPDWVAYNEAAQNALGAQGCDVAAWWKTNAVVLANLKTARQDLYDSLSAFKNSLEG